MDRLTKSINVVNIFGFCGMSGVFEYARHGNMKRKITYKYRNKFKNLILLSAVSTFITNIKVSFNTMFLNQGCDERCLLHGRCDENFICQCAPGWNGKFCTIHGCPNNCQGNGECTLSPHQELYHKLVINV